MLSTTVLKRFISAVSVLATALCSVLLAEADHPMTFRYISTACLGNNSTCGPYILAEGVIQPDSYIALLDLTSRLYDGKGKVKHNPPIRFNSAGGSVLGSIRLGFAIRDEGLETEVGGYYSEFSSGEEKIISRKPKCVSACVYAFVGGVKRSVHPNGTFAVHQFVSQSGVSNDSATQKLTATLSKHLELMGIEQKLLRIALQTLPETLRPLSRTELIELRIDNSGS